MHDLLTITSFLSVTLTQASWPAELFPIPLTQTSRWVAVRARLVPAQTREAISVPLALVLPQRQFAMSLRNDLRPRKGYAAVDDDSY